MISRSVVAERSGPVGNTPCAIGYAKSAPRRGTVRALKSLYRGFL